MTPQSAGYMCRIDSRMYAELHTSILQVNFLAIVEFYGLDKSDLIFQEENDPKHTPQKASKWFKQNNINVLKWHAQPPDLNPIKSVATPQVATNEYKVPPAGVHELLDQVKVEWERISKGVCRNLIRSMPRGVGPAIKGKKGKSKSWQKN